jgi:hypothetical protein
MSDPARPFDSGRPRPVVTVLDMLRTRIDHDDFDAAVFSLGAVAADLGYGDVRPLPGSIAWIDRLRTEGKRIAVQASGERVGDALELAGIADRFASSSAARTSNSASSAHSASSEAMRPGRSRWASRPTSCAPPAARASR